MIRLLILLLLLLLFQMRVHAQEQGPSLSLEQAIQTALSNNISVRQSQLGVERSQVNSRQAKANLLPSVNASIDHGLNQGRSIDPATNTYVEEEIMYASYGAGASLLLFQGFRQQNSIRQARFAREAAELELEQRREYLRLDIMLAYLQVLNNEDLVEIARDQVAVTEKQLERLQLLHEQGAINPPLIAELTGQLKAEELALLNARQSVEVAKLNLAQLMNVPYEESMQLERVALEELVVAAQEAMETEALYGRASEQLSIVKAARLRSQSAEAGVRMSRGGFSPRLFLNGNLYSNYSSVSRMNGERIHYQNQLRNNIFSNVSLSLFIPVFNGLQAHNQVKLAQLELQEVSLAEENTRLQLRQEVAQARLNLKNARERYAVLQEQHKAFTEAFRAAEIRFNAGAGTPVDYLLAKNNLDRASTSLLMAKYAYVLRLKVLEFYRGR